MSSQSGKTKSVGYLRIPSAAEIRECAARDYITLTESQAEELIPAVAQLLGVLDEVEGLADFAPPLKHHKRDPGRPPAPGEDPYNAFIRVCLVEGADDGPLKGKRVGIKDNLAVAGTPTTNASRTASYVPTSDSVVVERILDAGGTIVGKLNLDNFSFGSAAGYGLTSDYGASSNPHKPSHSAGGSSGGAGAAIAAGAVDLALGVDEAGSARLPASYCGCVAIKATHGLVPSFGVTYFDHTLDTICPMAASVRDAALLLSVVAGEDWRDPQWVRGAIEVDDYVGAVDLGVQDLRVGVVDETLDQDVTDPSVIAGVERAADLLSNAGAIVERIAIPGWYSAFPIFLGVILGSMPAMMKTDGVASGHLGFVDVARAHLMGLSRRLEADLYSPIIKLFLITNSVLDKYYFSTVYGKAMNQRLAYRRTIDEVFERYDVLLTPTTPTTSSELPKGRFSDMDLLTGATNQAPFTTPFNLTGHPAIAIPSGVTDEGLPTSVQIVSRRGVERDSLRVAGTLEQLLEVNLGPKS
jgi:amidase